ncbi:ArnT family glycosyltransferase [Allopusillimonas ginsengisoli]|uniref:ArnT family glycosyltransferase n=1 Tax=Allopusillimonas ginsengisoli TaxID=453575 RepID=UPI0010201E99|nr:glycosyltransferase [Allopusillimonas ginsengisoli]TEA79521.1 glycosyltransferase [Allopusillimonas ginsengisoli]
MSLSDSVSTPARLTATATVKLPRLALLGVGLIYILAGLFFRDPWKTDDVVGLAAMLTTLHEGGVTWLLPQIGTFAHAQDGPLSTWVGALCIWAFGPFFKLFTGDTLDAAIIASRLPNFLWFGLMTASVWYGSYLLGRRPEPQPLALPFGGEPTVQNYGRMIADAALLLIVATVGIVWRMHETSEVPAIIAFQALAFYSVARMLDHPASGATTLGLALAAAFLTRGWIGALPIMLAIPCIFTPRSPLWREKKWLIVTATLCTALILLWWIPARQLGTYWTQSWIVWNTSSFTWPDYHEVLSIFRDLPWFLWPTWPLALVAIWQWRGWLSAPHIRIPLMFALWPLVTMMFLVDAFEPEYSLMAIPAAVLAAFALPTLRRGFVNSLDWFAVMCYTLTSATVWLGWIALQTGWPEKISHNIARQTRGYDVYISWPAVIIALFGTLAWLALVRWRLHSKPAGLWRGTVLSAGGLIVTWLLLVTLWMPALDYVRSYRTVSGQLAHVLQENLPPGECVRAHGLGAGQRASFLVFNNINFSYDSHCALVLQQTNPDSLKDGSAAYSDTGTVLWIGKRGADRHEVFRLLRLREP